MRLDSVKWFSLLLISEAVSVILRQSSILEGGSVLTDDRVIMYFTNEDNELEIYELYFSEIATVELVSMGNMFNNSVYRVHSFNPDAWLEISLSAEKRGDIMFIERLRTYSQQ